MNDDEVFEAMAEGMNGLFWPLVDGRPEAPGIHGSIRRDDEGYWVVDLEGPQTAEDGEGPERGYPETLVGVLGGTTVLLSDQRRWQDFRLWSGQRLHVIRIRYETAVTGPDVNTISAEGIVSAQAFFPDQLKWIPERLPDWNRVATDAGAFNGWQIEVPAYNSSQHEIDDDLMLQVQGWYRTTWDLDKMTMSFGLGLTLKSVQPLHTSRFVETFVRLQDLISLCWGGRVPCLPGAGRVNAEQEDSGRFWSQQLLESHHAAPADLKGLPPISLADLGGPVAFVRWLELCRDFRRATRGVSESLYVGASAEVRLLNTATAIAYWVGANKRGEEWADLRQGDADNDLRRLVLHQLPTFEAWVGDGERFSARLWWDYNSLKHNPAHEIDYRVVSVFTTAARWLLIGSLLDRVAGTTAPSERIAGHFWQLREVTKELLEEPGRCDVPEGTHKKHARRK